MTRAVVIGGSLAGMSAAQVLMEAYDEVIVLDRDHFPTEVTARSGVPQSKHAHALLERGERELERLFPGFGAAATRSRRRYLKGNWNRQAAEDAKIRI